MKTAIFKHLLIGLGSVIFITHFAKLWCLFASQREMQTALRWWNSRQSLYFKHQAEEIQNGLLQELFAMRRSLELLSADQTDSLEVVPTHWLEKIETLHHALERISYTFSPPYIDESLPLAIQYFLEQLQQHVSHLTIEMDLTADRQDSSPEQNRIILAALDQFLQIILSPDGAKQSLQISLNYQGNLAELRVLIATLDREMLASLQNSQDLKYLKQSFQILTSGWCFWSQKTAAWHFCWRSKSI